MIEVSPTKLAIVEVSYCTNWRSFCWHIWRNAKENMAFTTLSGRKTEPIPLYKLSKNLAIATKQRRMLKLWLYEEAIMEALERGDRSFFYRFCWLFDREKIKADTTTEDDAEGVYNYLFVKYIKPQFTDIKLI
ncbi:hypothetical protein ACWIUH_05550 [Ursidibacter arcticus]